MGFFETMLHGEPKIHFQRIERDGRPPVLLVILHGGYSSGSSGKAYEELLRNRITEEFRRFCSDCGIMKDPRAVLDLKDFSYSWGDDFVEVLDFFNLTRTYAIVVGRHCRRGISTLMKMDPETKFDCIEAPGFFLYLGEALDYLDGL